MTFTLVHCTFVFMQSKIVIHYQDKFSGDEFHVLTRKRPHSDMYVMCEKFLIFLGA